MYYCSHLTQSRKSVLPGSGFRSRVEILIEKEIHLYRPSESIALSVSPESCLSSSENSRLGTAVAIVAASGAEDLVLK